MVFIPYFEYLLQETIKYGYCMVIHNLQQYPKVRYSAMIKYNIHNI